MITRGISATEQRKHGSLKRFAVIAVSAGMSVALVSGIGGPATEWSARAASYDVLAVAAIEESPSTIGIAEGHDLYLMSEAEIERTLDAMQALGVQNVRIGIFWADVESEEGVFNWGNVDRMVDAAARRGMGILGTVLYTPRWAGATQPPEETEWASHPDPEKFGNFVGEVAEKYAGRISAYEIWNEPTASMFWDPVDPEVYTNILKEGYLAIKAVDPSAVVIAGSVVAGPTYADGSSLSPVDFIEGMYDSGAQGYFDAISYHPYLYTMPFSNGANQPDQFEYPIEQLNAIRNLMIAKGDGNLKVWITEYGQPTNTVYHNTTLTEQQQAAYIEDLLRTWQNIDGAGPVFIYQTRDMAADSTDPDRNLGLYDFDWDPKLAAGVLADLIDELTPAGDPVNPLQAFLQQIAKAIGQALAFVPNLISQVVQAVVNFVSSILGINPVSAGASPGTARAASILEPEVAEEGSPVTSAQKMAIAETAPDTAADGNTEAVGQVQSLAVPEPPVLQTGQYELTSESANQVTSAGLDEVPIPGDDENLSDRGELEEAVELDPGDPQVTTERESLSATGDVGAADEAMNSQAESEVENKTPMNEKPDKDASEAGADAAD